MDTNMGESSFQGELFVVQRCWHSGPQQYAPMDFLRLFTKQRDAEEAAYHSAHAWCRYHKPNAEPQVKTLLLPSYPSSSTTGSSYGFIAYGSLFWVRSLLPTVTSDGNEGYAVITQGIIGGTGNRNSRRGTEVSTGRVFVGREARMQALRACHNVMAQFEGTTVATSVVTLPIGRPNDYSSNEFLNDWPPQVLQPSLLHPCANNENKRGANNIGPLSSIQEGVEVDCPFEMPAAKRRRCIGMNDVMTSPQRISMDSAMM